jgi:hypothetical protein
LKEIKTEIEIMASPELAWQVLTDFQNFAKWNPIIIQIKGEPKVGTKVEIHLRIKGGRTRIYKPTITKVEPNHELRWFGKSFFPGIFDGERIFTIKPIGTNNMRFFHNQIFSGLGTYLPLNRLEADVTQTLNEMNVAFKKQVEQYSIG